MNTGTRPRTPAHAQLTEKCERCGGTLTPRTDGRGGVVDECSRCGQRLVPLRMGASGNGAAQTAAGKPCPVKGCPGILAGDGSCPCCARRAEWARKHIPAKQCEICSGEIAKGKVCVACKPVSLRAWHLKKKAAASA